VRFAIDSELFQKSRRAQEERGLRVEDHGSAVEDRGLSIEDRATRTLNSGLAQEASISARSSILDPPASPSSGRSSIPNSSQIAPMRARRWRRLVAFAVGPFNSGARALAAAVASGLAHG